MSALISSYDNPSQLHDALINKTHHAEKAYVKIIKHHGEIKYQITDHLGSRVQDYAYKLFKRILNEISNETDAYKLLAEPLSYFYLLGIRLLLQKGSYPRFRTC